MTLLLQGPLLVVQYDLLALQHSDYLNLLIEKALFFKRSTNKDIFAAKILAYPEINV